MTVQETVNFSILIIVFGIGVVCYSKLTTPFKLLALTVPITILLDLCSKISAHLYKTNALVLHLECLVLYVFYSCIYYNLFQSKIMKKIVLVSTIVIVAFAFFNGIFLQPAYKSFPSFLYMVTNIMLVTFSLLLFKQMLLYPIKIMITSQGIFWYNTSMLFYSTTMFLNLGLTNYYAQLKFDEGIYYFWYGSYYILNILTGIALFSNYKEKKSEYA
jgi:hypothetical protein